MRIAYLAVPDSIEVVAQTPSAPNGEASESRAAADVTPLVFVSDGPQNFCAEGAEPGDRILVETNVLARAFAGVGVQPRFNEDSATQYKNSMVKIVVSACDGSSRRIIDPGFPIVVRGPTVRIGVLAPGQSADLDRNATTRVDGRGAAQVEESFEVAIFASVCPLGCYSPPPAQLTYWFAHDAAVPAEQLRFVVPRGARRLTLGDVDGSITDVQFWQGEPGAAASRQIGVQAIVPAPAETFDVPIFGSPTHLQFNGAPAAPGFILMRWEIV